MPSLNSPPPKKKTMYDTSGQTIGNYKGFTWQVSQRKAGLPSPDLVHSQCITVSKGSGSQGLKPLGLDMFLCIFTFLAHAPKFTGLPLVPQLRSSCREVGVGVVEKL